MGHPEYVRLGLQRTGDGLVVLKLLAELVNELPDSEQVALHRGRGFCCFVPDFHLLVLVLVVHNQTFVFLALMAAASLSGLSASVTRILSLTGFPRELKTKDIQSAFSDWETVNGGFKIKWKDDTSLLIVFQDATVAKRAYLQAIAYPPPILTSSSTGASAVVKPYDGPDAQAVIQTVNARGQHHSNPSRSHAPRAASISVPLGTHARAPSAALHNGNQQNFRLNASVPYMVNEREPSPTLPSLPSHPSLNSLINSSLGDAVTREATSAPPSDPAILASSLHPDILPSSAPRIGDPGKRMLGAALGVRHPSLGPRVLSNSGSSSPSPNNASQVGTVDQAMGDVQRTLGGLTVAE